MPAADPRSDVLSLTGHGYASTTGDGRVCRAHRSPEGWRRGRDWRPGRRRHPRYGGMQVGFRDLTVWSFLMASAHGAGFMVLPFVMPTPAALSAASHVHASHAAVAGANVATKAATFGATAVALHTLAYLAVMCAVAWIVYRKLGLSVLRRAWYNTDSLWAGALVVTGLIVLFK